MPKKLRPEVDLMAFKCRTLKVNTCIRLSLVITANKNGERRRCSGYLMHSGKSENEIMPSNRLRAYYSINLQWLEACGDSVHAGNTADYRKNSEKHSGNQNLACLTVINHHSSTKNELGKTDLFFLIA
jgi:hypothetical protein